MTFPGTITFLKAVLEASWQGSLVILLVLLVRPMLGFRIPARWRSLLWMLVLIRLLVPAFILPRSPASLQNIAAVERPIEHAQASVDRAYLDYVGEEIRRHESPFGRIEAAVPAPAEKPHRAIPWWQLCAAVWVSGAALFATWIVGAGVRLHRRLRLEEVDVDENVVIIWKRCCSRFLVKHPPRLVMTGLVDSPALVGVARPALLIPRQAAEMFSPGDWEHIFMHELAHYRRRDHWTQAVQLLALCIHWFNPLVWLGFRFLRADRELATDELALGTLAGDHAAAYGDTLLKVLAGRSAGSLQPGMVSIMEDGAQIKQRLRRIVAFGPRRVLGSAVGLALTIVIAVLVLGRQVNKAEDAKASPSSSAETKSAGQGTSYEPLLAAARAGDAPLIRKVIIESFKGKGLGTIGAKESLDSLVRSRELKPFVLLLKELRQTSLGKDWQPDETLLAGLVKEGRTDFLDVLLGERLDLKQLQGQQKVADATMAAWIARRVAETEHERKDIQTLIAACSKGDVATVQQLLDAGVNVNSRASDGSSWTPLTRAAVDGRVEIVRLLLKRGAEPDLPKFPGWDYTPLCLAKTREIADLLLAAGANINAKLYGRDTHIISYCVMFGPTEMVQWFIDHGVDPNKVNGEGPLTPTLLFVAGKPEIAELLIGHGMDVNAKDEQGVTAMFRIEQMAPNPSKIVEVLLKHGANPNMRVAGGYTPLMAATDGETVDALVAAGADINAKDDGGTSVTAYYVPGANASRWEALRRHVINLNIKEGASMLRNATIRHAIAEVKTLLDQGVDPNAADINDTDASPLAVALYFGEFEIAGILRKAGAKDVGVFSEATAKGDVAQMKILMDGGADVNERSGFGDTPLHFAVRRGQPKAVDFLLDHGANINLFNGNGLTPHVLAKLLDFGIKASSDWSPIEKMNGKEARQAIDAILALLREHKPDVNYKNAEGETALFPAAKSGNGMTLSVFIERGANFNVQRKDGMTPMMLAVATQPKNASITGVGSTETTDPKTNKKEHYSSRGSFVKTLLDKGADLSIRNNAGKTALDLARENGNEEILSLLDRASKTKAVATP